MRIAYVHLENGVNVTSMRDDSHESKPKDIVAICPKDDKGNWITDLDVLDIIDGVASFNKSKYDAKLIQLTNEQDLENLNNLPFEEAEARLRALDKSTLDPVIADIIKCMMG